MSHATGTSAVLSAPSTFPQSIVSIPIELCSGHQPSKLVILHCFCWALQRTFDPTPGIPQEHDSTTRRLSSVYPRQATHVLFTK